MGVRNEELIMKRASGYRSNSGSPFNAPYIDMQIPGAAGALLSTVGNLHKWGRALAAGKVLKGPGMAKMWTVEKSGYAYGWVLQQ